MLTHCIDVYHLPKETRKPKILIFQSSFASKHLEKIVQHQDLYEARKCAGKRQKEGPSVKERSLKRTISFASNHEKAGTDRMDKTPVSQCQSTVLKRSIISKRR